MDPNSASGTARRAQVAPGRLERGTRLSGGRYTIDRLARRSRLGEAYDAADGATGGAVTVLLLDPGLLAGVDLARLGDDVRAAAQVSHANLAQPIEVGSEGEHVFVVSELAEGHTLAELIARKQETGTVGFGAKGASNLALHMCAALAAAHGARPHGLLATDGIVVSKSGRIKVCDLGLGALARTLAQRGPVAPTTAPEVVAGAAPSKLADIFALGALLYEVLMGAPPSKGCARPSEALAGVPPSVDAVVARAMAQNPAQRYPTVDALREAVQVAFAEAQVSGAQPVQRPSGQQPAASLAESLGRGAPAAASPASPSAQRSAQAVSETDEKWLISKGKLDYGPYNLTHVLDQIRANQILPGHIVIDKDTGGRCKVEDHPLLGDPIEVARHKRDESRRAQAEVQHAAQEKRRGATLYLFIGLGALALAGGAYLLWSKLAAHKADDKKGAIESLEGGKFEAQISFPSKEQRKARHNAHHGGSGGGAHSGGAAGGWDDTLDLDMDSEGGDARLDDSQVNPVIQSKGGALGRCLTSTSTHSANIEFIVKGTGRVSSVRVNGETGSAVANCVRGVMQSMQFPTFDGQRSKHYFDMAF